MAMVSSHSKVNNEVLSLIKGRCNISFLSCLLGVLLFVGGCSKLNNLSAEQLLVKACVAAEKGKWRDSKKYAEAAYKKKKDDFLVLLMLAITQANCNEKTEALKTISQACIINKQSFAAYLLKGQLLVDLEKYGDSIAPLKRALELRPSRVEPLILLAAASAKLDLPQAVKYYALLAKKFKTRPEPYNELGLLLADENVKSALKCLLKARKLDKQNSVIILNLAVFCDMYLNNKKAAEKFYELYLAGTRANPAIKKKREEVLERLKELQKPQSGIN